MTELHPVCWVMSPVASEANDATEMQEPGVGPIPMSKGTTHLHVIGGPRRGGAPMTPGTIAPEKISEYRELWGGGGVV